MDLQNQEQEDASMRIALTAVTTLEKLVAELEQRQEMEKCARGGITQGSGEQMTQAHERLLAAIDRKRRATEQQHTLQLAKESLEKAKVHFHTADLYAKLLSQQGLPAMIKGAQIGPTAGVQSADMVEAEAAAPPFDDNVIECYEKINKAFGGESTNLKKQDKYEKLESFTEDNYAKNPFSNKGSYKFHAAIKFNNNEVTKLHDKFGCEFDFGDSTEITSLLVAVMHEDYEAAKLLRREQVDQLVRKFYGVDALSKPFYHYHKHEVEIWHSYIFVQKMIEKKFDATRIGKALAAIGCHVDEVVQHRDPVLTKFYLQSYTNETIDPNPAFSNDMLGFDMQHIKILTTYGPKSKERKEQFIWLLLENICEYQKFTAGRDFLKKLSCWDVLDEDFFAILEEYLQKLPKRVVKIILQYNLGGIAKAKYGRDITGNLFGNSSQKVILLLKNEIDVDKRYHGGNTPLHIASKYYAARNIQLLLTKGADPNAFNDEQDTPLSVALKSSGNSDPHSVESIKLLLFAGADPIIIYGQFKSSFFGFNSSTSASDYAMDVIKLLVAQLAAYEAVGLSVNQIIKEFMKLDNRGLEEYFQKCRHELKRLKSKEIQDSNTNQEQDTCKMNYSILALLVKNPEKIVRHFSEEQLQMIDKSMTKYKQSLSLYYRALLDQRVKDIIELFSYRKRAIQIICRFIRIHDHDHLVVHKIVNYLAVKDLVVFKDEKKTKHKIKYRGPVINSIMYH